jgi:glucose-1-phosphate thymidylyltransferase
MKTKGIILAGGFGTRLYPITQAYSKQLISVYDKPMLYYPLNTLISLSIKDILIISVKEMLPLYKKLLERVSLLGLNIEYAIQDSPKGIAEAFIIGERFVGNDNVCLILGDNIFYGADSVLYSSINNHNINSPDNVNTIFALYVKDAHRYGVVMFENNVPIKIVEKPKTYISNYVIPGIYYYSCDVINIAKVLKPSNRKELEITDINNILLKENKLNVVMLNRGVTWLDCGTPQSLLAASNFISSVEERHGIKVGCFEETAYKMNFCVQEQLIKYVNVLPDCDYKNYLHNIFSKEPSIQLF